MTTVSQIITDAYRQSNLIAIGVAPTALQETEGLRYINRIVKSTLGFEVGDPLANLPIGRHNISHPQGYPWWNTVPDNYWYVPKDTRLMLNVETAMDIYLTPAPEDGTRFAYRDQSNNLSTYPVTFHGNGALLDGATEITVNTNGAAAEYLFRSDTGNWHKYSTLGLFDEFPFPEEFDDYFILSLAFRLNPAYQRAFDQQSLVIYNKQRTMLRARYSEDIQMRSELALVRMSKMANDRDRFGSAYWMYQPNAMFDKGWPW